MSDLIKDLILGFVIFWSVAEIAIFIFEEE